MFKVSRIRRSDSSFAYLFTERLPCAKHRWWQHGAVHPSRPSPGRGWERAECGRSRGGGPGAGRRARTGRAPRCCGGEAGGTGRWDRQVGQAGGFLLLHRHAVGIREPRLAPVGREVQIWEPWSRRRLGDSRVAEVTREGYGVSDRTLGPPPAPRVLPSDLCVRVPIPTFLRNRLDCRSTCCSGSSFRGRRPDTEPTLSRREA